jgi:hypothetical protein
LSFGDVQGLLQSKRPLVKLERATNGCSVVAAVERAPMKVMCAGWHWWSSPAWGRLRFKPSTTRRRCPLPAWMHRSAPGGRCG